MTGMCAGKGKGSKAQREVSCAEPFSMNKAGRSHHSFHHAEGENRPSIMIWC